MKKIYYLIAMAFVALTFTSCEDVPSPYGQPINPNATATVDPAGSGTADDPFNIAGAIAKCKEIGDVVSSEKYYVKGYAATAATADASYGNVSFYLTDSQDGKGKRFYAYQVAGSDGQKLAAGYTINVGDEVVIYGPMYNYNGSTPETASKGAAYIVTVNGEKTNGGSSSGGETVDPTGEGTAAAPYNVAGIIAATKDLASGSTTSNEIYATGYVTGTPKFNDKYSSMSYYICDDAEGKTQSFYVYSGNGLDNKTFSSADDLKAGDKVTVCGKVTNYNGTIEFQSKNYLVMLNDQTGSGGGGDTPTPSSGNMTKAVSGTVVTFTSSSITGSDEVTVDFNAQGWADKAAATTVTLANGTKIEFAGGENTSNAPTFYSATKGIRVYAKNTITVKGSKAIAKIVLNCDSYNGTDYVGNDMSYANADGNNVTICNDNTEAKGGVQMRVQTMVITFQGEGTGGGGSGGSGDTSGTGTQASPLSASQAYDAVAALAADAESSSDYWVKGKICSIKYTYSAQYGTATFNISDNGDTGNKEFTVYGTYYHASEQKWVEGDTQIAVGDEVLVCGKVINYKGTTPEFSNKKNYVVTINGK